VLLHYRVAAQDASGFCANERFSDQEVIPTAFCTGFLLSKNPPLLATAAHCVSDGISTTTVVFRYELLDNDGTNLIYDDSDVYTIANIIVEGSPDGRENDYALVQLDRAVTGRDAYDEATSKVDVGDSTILIGHPAGIPKKYDSGGSVQAIQVNGALIRATVDAYGGNSGSPVFNNDRELIGILVAGGTDFVSSSTCRLSNVCPGGESCDPNGEYIASICNLLGRSEVRAVLDLECDDGDNNTNSNNSNSNTSNDSSSSSMVLCSLIVTFAFTLFSFL